MPVSRTPKQRGAVCCGWILILLTVLVAIGIIVYLAWLWRDDGYPKLQIVPKPKGTYRIAINRDDENQESKWANEIDEFIEKYREPARDGKICSFENDKRADDESFCIVDIDRLGGCSSAENGYGYTGGVGQPCVLLKLSNAKDWEPEPYTVEDFGNLISLNRYLPQDIQNNIRRLNHTSSYVLDHRRLDTVWVTCGGKDDDIGQIAFYSIGDSLNSFPGIPGYYFPYLDQSGYQSPFVFIKFLNPPVNKVFKVECKAWAKNMDGPSDSDSATGFTSVEFEVLID
jgi:hypothetical protein